MAEAGLKIGMEAWRFIRRAMESDLGRNESLYCPDSFDITMMLETGEPPDDFPEENLLTSVWWPLVVRMRSRGVRHGNDAVEVMMTLRSNCAVGATWWGHSDWEVNYREYFPGRVRLVNPGELDFVELFRKKKIGFKEFFKILGR